MKATNDAWQSPEIAVAGVETAEPCALSRREDQIVSAVAAVGTPRHRALPEPDGSYAEGPGQTKFFFKDPIDLSIGEALRLFELHPDFPRTQVGMRERIEESERGISAEARAFGSAARMEYILSLLGIRAEAILELVADVEMQRAFRIILDCLGRVAYWEHTGAPLEVLWPASPAADAYLAKIEAKVHWWIGQGYRQLASRQTQIGSAALTAETKGGRLATAEISRNPTASARRKRHPETNLEPTKWEDIEISFLSEHRLQVRVCDGVETFNYGDLGLNDRRSNNPNQAWQALLQLANNEGSIRSPLSGQDWLKTEKRVQAIRQFLRHHFNLPGDPLPCAEGQGYRARFSVLAYPSFKT